MIFLPKVGLSRCAATLLRVTKAWSKEIQNIQGRKRSELGSTDDVEASPTSEATATHTEHAGGLFRDTIAVKTVNPGIN